jgi:hypothetical protein
MTAKKCQVREPFVLQSHSKTMEFNTYDHIVSLMVPSSISLLIANVVGELSVQ